MGTIDPLKQFSELFFGETSALYLGAQQKRRYFTVQRDDQDGVSGFLQGDVAPLGRGRHEARPLKGADNCAS